MCWCNCNDTGEVIFYSKLLLSNKILNSTTTTLMYRFHAAYILHKVNQHVSVVSFSVRITYAPCWKNKKGDTSQTCICYDGKLWFSKSKCQSSWKVFETKDKSAVFQIWRSIHTYWSSEKRGPSKLKQTALCSSKKSIWHSRSRHICSTRFRQTDQSSTALDTPRAPIQTDPKMSRKSGQSSRKLSSSIWCKAVFTQIFFSSV